jgi:putative membrane protein
MVAPSKQNTTRFFLLSSYLAGMIAVRGLGYQEFLYLTPFNLLLTLGLLVWNHEPRSRGLWQFILLAYLTGYFIEVAGVNTGAIFGVYQYGEVLGWKLWGAPLLIGVNWVLVVYTGNEVLNRWLGDRPLLVRTALGALIPVALDWLIEPVAIQYGMWQWEAGTPPLQNYLAWYAVSLFLSGAYQYWIGGALRNRAAPLILVLQILFFIILRV